MNDLIRVADVADPRLADYRDLRDVTLRRRLEAERGLFMAEGEKVIRRATAAGYKPRSFLLAERWLDSLQDVVEGCPDTPCYVTDVETLRMIAGFSVHRGALASMHRRALPALTDVIDDADTAIDQPVPVARTSGRPAGDLRQRNRRIAVLEDVVDHTNVGAAFRSAAALGVDGVLVTPRCADPLYRRSVKVSMGAVFQVPWTRIAPWPRGIDLLHEHGYVTAALTLDEDAMTLEELAARCDPRLALIFGTEGDGLRRSTVAAADLIVHIPMAAGIDSLNVAAAAAVAFYATRAG